MAAVPVGAVTTAAPAIIVVTVVSAVKSAIAVAVDL